MSFGTKIRKTLKVSDMRFIDRILKIPWMTKKTSIQVLRETVTKTDDYPHQDKTVMMLCHINSGDGLENTVTNCLI